MSRVSFYTRFPRLGFRMISEYVLGFKMLITQVKGHNWKYPHYTHKHESRKSNMPILHFTPLSLQSFHFNPFNYQINV